MMQEQWLGFAVVALAATMTPGPAILFTMQNAMASGAKPAFAGALGNATGLVVVSVLSFAGVSVLLQQSPLAFTVLKLSGAGYLLYLAWLQWQQASGISAENLQCSELVAACKLHSGWYNRGVGVALTNPKAWLFISALYPQFINLTEPALPQYVGLTVIFAGCSIVAHTVWLSVVRLGMESRPNVKARRLLGQLQALLFAIVALSLWWTPLA